MSDTKEKIIDAEEIREETKSKAATATPAAAMSSSVYEKLWKMTLALAAIGLLVMAINTWSTSIGNRVARDSFILNVFSVYEQESDRCLSLLTTPPPVEGEAAVEPDTAVFNECVEAVNAAPMGQALSDWGRTDLLAETQ